jgi:hypothetical protein
MIYVSVVFIRLNAIGDFALVFPKITEETAVSREDFQRFHVSCAHGIFGNLRNLKIPTCQLSALFTSIITLFTILVYFIAFNDAF